MADGPDENDVIVDDTALDSLRYLGNWSVSTHPTDYGGSRHVTSDSESSVSFGFVGERFWYYSDTSTDHSNYSIWVDNVTVQPSLSSYSAKPQSVRAIYNQPVAPGSHVVRVTNLDPQKVLTVDYFVFRPVSNEAPNSQDVKIQPDDPSVTFAPSDAWSPGNQTPGYRETRKKGAYFRSHLRENTCGLNGRGTISTGIIRCLSMEKSLPDFLPTVQS